MGFLKYKGYSGSVEFSPEDNCLFGKVQGLHKAAIIYEGNSVDELRKDFENGVDDYIAGCKERGVQPEKTYSGKLVVRMPSELHSRIAEAVSGSDTTINDFINKAIVNELDHEYAMP